VMFVGYRPRNKILAPMIRLERKAVHRSKTFGFLALPLLRECYL
jgi:hypothetical protein